MRNEYKTRMKLLAVTTCFALVWSVLHEAEASNLLRGGTYLFSMLQLVTNCDPAPISHPLDRLVDNNSMRRELRMLQGNTTEDSTLDGNSTEAPPTTDPLAGNGNNDSSSDSRKGCKGSSDSIDSSSSNSIDSSSSDSVDSSSSDDGCGRGSSSKSSLSSPAGSAGISVGALAFVGLIAGGLFALKKRRTSVKADSREVLKQLDDNSSDKTIDTSKV